MVPGPELAPRGAGSAQSVLPRHRELTAWLPASSGRPEGPPRPPVQLQASTPPQEASGSTYVLPWALSGGLRTGLRLFPGVGLTQFSALLPLLVSLPWKPGSPPAGCPLGAWPGLAWPAFRPYGWKKPPLSSVDCPGPHDIQGTDGTKGPG